MARLAKSGGKVVQVNGLPTIQSAASPDGFAAAAKAAAAADVTVGTFPALSMPFPALSRCRSMILRFHCTAMPQVSRSPHRIAGLKR